MKKVIVCALMCVFFLCGCGNGAYYYSNISRLNFIRIIGLDKGENKKLLMTLGSEVPVNGGGDGETSLAKQVIEIECDYVYEGLRELESQTENKIFYGQASIILIGEELAREGITDWLDTFTRDGYFGFDMPLIVVKGDKAQKLIDKSQPKSGFVSDQLIRLLEDSGIRSVSGKVTLAEVSNRLEDPFDAVYMPYLALAEAGDSIEMNLKGYSVFSGGRLTYFLSETESRGLNWMRSTIVSGLINVCLDKDIYVLLEILSGNSSMTMNGATVEIKVNFSTSIACIQGPFKEKVDETMLKRLIGLQNEVIQKEIVECIAKLQELKQDVCGFGNVYYRSSPQECWARKNDWPEIFAKMKYQVVVNSFIEYTKVINDPIEEW